MSVQRRYTFPDKKKLNQTDLARLIASHAQADLTVKQAQRVVNVVAACTATHLQRGPGQVVVLAGVGTLRMSVLAPQQKMWQGQVLLLPARSQVRYKMSATLKVLLRLPDAEGDAL